jgi:aspartyl-tRNA(Asn)/glutamyl-tRNA(Gln) amidotransferase subunit C
MITKETVKHIAKLARLGLTPKETEKMQKDLSLILDYFNLLKGVDVTGIEPTFHSISNLDASLRKDETKKELKEGAEKLIKAAPEREGRHVRVKEIL